MHGTLNNCRHALNHMIASLMAEAIVNAFKVIDVDHHAAHRLIIAHCLSYLSAQGIFQVVAVTQAGERVE